ncbi:MAG: hypothetical protein AAF696_37185, partial [Bacteroidota bacterium]
SRFPKIHPYLNDIFAINLGEEFIDSQCDRIKRNQLGYLLDHISSLREIQGVYLDFAFYPIPGNEYEDSVLVQIMKKLGNKLVLPYELGFNGGPVPIFASLSQEEIENSRNELAYLPNYSGYLNTMSLSKGLEVYRYHKYRIEDGSDASVINAILDAMPNEKSISYLNDMPSTFEINYLLRNQVESSSFDKSALNNWEASQLLEWPEDSLREKLRGKFLMIALFGSYRTKYDIEINKFPTPISSNLGGIYLMLNAYLNVLGGSYLRMAPPTIIFILNFVLAFSGSLYYSKKSWFNLPSVGWLVFEVFFYGFMLLSILLLFYYYWNIKYPFVITSLAFVRNQTFFKLFLNYENHMSKYLTLTFLSEEIRSTT